jgi:tetratricopeptide (TPR) repeat protein
MKEPNIPSFVSLAMLDKEHFVALEQYPLKLMKRIALHIISAEVFVEDNAPLAFKHARYILKIAPELPLSHELVGLCAYKMEMYPLALSELLLGRKMNLSNDYSAMIMDSLRALGKKESAIDFYNTIDLKELSKEQYVELRIVYAGIKADQGEYDEAKHILNSDIRQKGFSTVERYRLQETKSLIFEQSGDTAGAKEIMERISPTRPKKQNSSEDSDGVKVYDLLDESEEDEIDEYVEPIIDLDNDDSF